MTQGIGAAAVSQSYELLGASLAKSQQKQEGQMVMQLLQTAANSAPASAPVGNLGNNIDISV